MFQHQCQSAYASRLFSVVRVRRKQAVERDEEAFAAGCKSARSAIAAGRRLYRWTGHAGPWGHWLVIQLARRFGVEVNDGFGICCVTASGVSFNDGYNSVLVAEIDRCHGGGAFQSLLTESRAQSEESLWDAKALWLK